MESTSYGSAKPRDVLGGERWVRAGGVEGSFVCQNAHMKHVSEQPLGAGIDSCSPGILGWGISAALVPRRSQGVARQLGGVSHARAIFRICFPRRNFGAPFSGQPARTPPTGPGTPWVGAGARLGRFASSPKNVSQREWENTSGTHSCRRSGNLLRKPVPSRKQKNTNLFPQGG